MAASQTMEKHEDSRLLQGKGRTNTGDPRASSSMQRFQKMTQKVMLRSSTGAHQVAPHNFKAISNGTSKDCHNSVEPVMACPCDDGNCHFSHRSASSTNRRAANNGNPHQYSSQKQKAQDQSARSSHPAPSKDRNGHASSTHHTLVSNHGPSLTQLKSSSINNISHRSSSDNLHVIAEADVVPPLDSAVQAKSASQKIMHASSEMNKMRVPPPKRGGSVQEKNAKGRIETKDLYSKHKRSSQNELCKDCKSSIRESVCFINNDGRIAAALMHPLHHCKKPGCAANRGNYPYASTMPKRTPFSKRQVPPYTHSQPRIHKLGNSAKLVGNSSSVCSSGTSSVQASGHDSKHQELIPMKEICMTARSLEGDGESQLTTKTDTDPHDGGSYHDQTGVHNSSPCTDKDVFDDENLRCWISKQIEEYNEENSTHAVESSTPCPSSDIIHDCADDDDDGDDENSIHAVECSTPPPSCPSSDIILDCVDDDDDDEPGSVERNAVVELHDSKLLCYHGDNEYSCSDNGTDVTTTPNSLVRGAFDNVSNPDVEEHQDDKVSQSQRSSMASMRWKYLQTLKEQEAERVRLRKQEIMARKQAGDWMLDCHMEELLHKLAPNGEARVKVLVEAFETVIHHSDSESSHMHHEEHNQLHDEQEEQHDNVHTGSSS